jgi:co-chaperonin GroES (HSP10)
MTNTVKGTITPLHDKIFVCDMEFGEETTKGGIIMPSGNGKSSGIHPRWGKVWAIGPDQKDIKIGEWILVLHGRWTRTFNHEAEDGTITELRMVENDAILMSADEKPEDSAMRMAAVGAGSNINFNIPGAT